MESTKFSPDHEMFVQIFQLSCSLENKIYVRVYILVPRPKLGQAVEQLIVIGSFALKECCGWEGNAG